MRQSRNFPGLKVRMRRIWEAWRSDPEVFSSKQHNLIDEVRYEIKNYIYIYIFKSTYVFKCSMISWKTTRSNAILDQVVCVLNDLGLPRDPALRTSEVVKRLRSQGVSWWKHYKATQSQCHIYVTYSTDPVRLGQLEAKVVDIAKIEPLGVWGIWIIWIDMRDWWWSLSMMDCDGWDMTGLWGPWFDSGTTWWLGLAHGDMVWPPEVLWLICRAGSPRSRTRRDRRDLRYRAKPHRCQHLQICRFDCLCRLSQPNPCTLRHFYVLKRFATRCPAMIEGASWGIDLSLLILVLGVLMSLAVDGRGWQLWWLPREISKTIRIRTACCQSHLQLVPRTWKVKGICEAESRHKEITLALLLRIPKCRPAQEHQLHSRNMGIYYCTHR